MGCGTMSPALLLLLSLANCSLLQGMLLRPRHVRLEAQNFHVWLHWEPDPSSPSYATYEVQWRNRTSSWTKADSCRGNSSSSWVCALYFDNIYDIYWARVRVVAGGEQSEWASSSELQPYRDTIVGPPKLSWLLQDQILSVKIITPPTPYQRRTGSYKRVSRVLLKLWYWLHLYEGELLVQQVPCERSREEEPCTVGQLKASTQYCVRTVAAGIARERSREAERCLVTPAAPAGFSWVAAMLSAFFLLLLLSVVGLCFLKRQLFPNSPETRLPRALVLRSSELSGAVWVLPLPPEEPLAPLLHTVLPSRGPPAAGQAAAPLPQPLQGLARDVSGYCANGFGPECPGVRDPSCPRGQLGHALGRQVPSQLEEDGEAGDGDDLPEQLVLVELTGNSYIGDRDSETPETWLPLHLQLHSKCQCPVLGAGSRLPLPVPSRSCGQEHLQESLGTAGRWIQLSSVKLPSAEEEEGGQLPCAPQALLGRGAAPGHSSVQRGAAEPCAPCPGPPLPCSPLWPAAFSGYEPRAPVAAGHGECSPPAAPSSQHSPGHLPELPSHGSSLSHRLSQPGGAGLGVGPGQRRIPGTAKDGQDPELSSGGLVLLRHSIRSMDQS